MRALAVVLAGETVVAGMVAQVVTSTAGPGGLVFDAGQVVGIVTALLAAVAGALTFTFRLLLAAKQEQVAGAEKRIAGLELLLSQASNRAEAQEHRLAELLTGAVRASELAAIKASETMVDVVHLIKASGSTSSAEHKAIVEALQRLSLGGPAPDGPPARKARKERS